MEFEEQIEVVRQQYESMDGYIRSRLAEIAVNHGMAITTNVAINLGTSCCAVALLAMEDEQMRETALDAILAATKSKIEEGMAQIQAFKDVNQTSETLQ